MKSLKLFAAIVLAVAMASGASLAQQKQPAKQTCCQKALAEGKECKNKCCITAHRQGKSCEKCNPNKEDAGFLKKSDKKKA